MFCIGAATTSALNKPHHGTMPQRIKAQMPGLPLARVAEEPLTQTEYPNALDKSAPQAFAHVENYD